MDVVQNICTFHEIFALKTGYQIIFERNQIQLYFYDVLSSSRHPLMDISLKRLKIRLIDTLTQTFGEMDLKFENGLNLCDE